MIHVIFIYVSVIQLKNFHPTLELKLEHLARDRFQVTVFNTGREIYISQIYEKLIIA